jgi:hypothetical protein
MHCLPYEAGLSGMILIQRAVSVYSTKMGDSVSTIDRWYYTYIAQYFTVTGLGMFTVQVGPIGTPPTYYAKRSSSLGGLRVSRVSSR